MRTAEVKKIALIIFHVITVMLLFTSVSLVLDKIFTQDSTDISTEPSFENTFELVFTIATIFLAAASWYILVKKWIHDRKLAYYLKSLLFTNTIIIIGLVLLLLV
ncbi:hypothetical protein K8089_10945 [Aequorivita sp. F47161]|uniref:Uncharacterized protein n=1 Tax=Aequorivita vitellina TaxID=2874475 RepID=A0A9X1UAE7_9FLAO|nr:hypothetical protein [Aequorivita vitellina]MCG2419541.1 hypothetical protein [Aequorivita vitellina]